MLVAGAGADNAPAWDGALSFLVSSPPLDAGWSIGSAKNTIFNTRLNISRYWRDLNNGF